MAPKDARSKAEWLYEVEWPNSTFDMGLLKTKRDRSEIAARLLGYVLNPPPTLPRAGGRPSRARGSGESLTEFNIREF